MPPVQVGVQAPQSSGGGFGGVPTRYLIIGGGGLAAVAIMIARSRSGAAGAGTSTSGISSDANVALASLQHDLLSKTGDLSVQLAKASAEINNSVSGGIDSLGGQLSGLDTHLGAVGQDVNDARRAIDSSTGTIVGAIGGSQAAIISNINSSASNVLGGINGAAGNILQGINSSAVNVQAGQAGQYQSLRDLLLQLLAADPGQGR